MIFIAHVSLKNRYKSLFIMKQLPKMPSPMDFKLQLGDKLTHPQELTFG
jgi:hypothetical protein